MPARELKTAEEVRQHARKVQRRIDKQFKAGAAARAEQQQRKAPPAPPEPPEPPASEPPVRNVRHPVRRIMDIAARHFRRSSGSLLGSQRKSAVVTARHVGYYVARRLGWSASGIGHWVDHDHSTVQHGAKTIAERIKDNDADIIAAVDAVGAEAAESLGMTWQPAATHFSGDDNKADKEPPQ